MNFSSVVSLHMNPMTCGVAKFSHELARRLGIPCVPLANETWWGPFPLFSLKASEVMAERPAPKFWAPKRYGVFWHDEGMSTLAAKADVQFYADPSLGPNGLWCPSLLTPSKPRVVRLFSFGMAHKLQPKHYAKVRALLDAAGLRYHLRVSVGIHEGTSLDNATKHFDALKEIMGAENVTILGILSDDAVAEELSAADTVLAFFEKGLRANNTTVHAANAAGRRIVSNCDEQTGVSLRSLVLDITSMDRWPDGANPYSWGNLIDAMEGIYAKSIDWQPSHI